MRRLNKIRKQIHPAQFILPNSSCPSSPARLVLYGRFSDKRFDKGLQRRRRERFGRRGGGLVHRPNPQPRIGVQSLEGLIYLGHLKPPK